MRASATFSEYHYERAKTHANSRFRRYAPEEEKAVRKVDVKGNEALERIVEAWQRYLPMQTRRTRSPEVLYEEACTAIGTARYTGGDVERFCIYLTGFQDENGYDKAGFFLSALVNLGTERSYRIITGHLYRKVRYLCVKNVKDVKIDGDAGKYVGLAMSAGSVKVLGDGGGYCASKMTGGQIEIMGSSGMVGNQNDGIVGGKVIIHGSVTGDVHGSSEAELFVGGDASWVAFSGRRLEILGNVKHIKASAAAHVIVNGNVDSISSSETPIITVGGTVSEPLIINL